LERLLPKLASRYEFGSVILHESLYEGGAMPKSKVDSPDGFAYQYKEPDRIRALNLKLLAYHIRPVGYLHPFNWSRAGYQVEDVVDFIRRMAWEFGWRGVFLDGTSFGNNYQTLKLVEAIATEVFSWRFLTFSRFDNRLTLHLSWQVRNGLGFFGPEVKFSDYVLIGENDRRVMVNPYSSPLVFNEEWLQYYHRLLPSKTSLMLKIDNRLPPENWVPIAARRGVAFRASPGKWWDIFQNLYWPVVKPNNGTNPSPA